MKKFKVTHTIGETIVYEVEAKDKDDAEDKAASLLREEHGSMEGLDLLDVSIKEL